MEKKGKERGGVEWRRESRGAKKKWRGGKEWRREKRKKKKPGKEKRSRYCQRWSEMFRDE